MTGRRAAMLALAALLAAGPATARDAGDRRPGRPPDRPKAAAGPAKSRAGRAAAGPVLNAVDRETVRAWLAAHPDWTPPAPPAGRPVRGQALPPGVAGEALPPELAMQLPYFPGYRYRALGGDLVLLAKGGGLVAGVLPGALAR